MCRHLGGSSLLDLSYALIVPLTYSLEAYSSPSVALESGYLVSKRTPTHHTELSNTNLGSGNTFPATVFCLFGGFWFTFGATIVPAYGAYGSYSTTGHVADGLDAPQFYATFSFLLVAMTILCAVFTVASIRTNVVFFGILFLLVPTCKSRLTIYPRRQRQLIVWHSRLSCRLLLRRFPRTHLQRDDAAVRRRRPSSRCLVPWLVHLFGPSSGGCRLPLCLAPGRSFHRCQGQGKR